MKKRTAFIGAILSLIPLGQPLIIKTGVVLSTTGLMLSVAERVNAETANFYLTRGFNKAEVGDHDGAIADYTKAIEINSSSVISYINRGITKYRIGDKKGACLDARAGKSLGASNGAKVVELLCQ